MVFVLLSRKRENYLKNEWQMMIQEYLCK